MYKEEHDLISQIDEIVLLAQGKDLQKIQELDIKTQLRGNSFYDEYLSSHLVSSKTNQVKNYHKNI
jgi:hypothetical protein